MSERDRRDEAVVLGDIHGNVAAMEAVLEDVEARGLGEDRYCLGDPVGYGTFPNEVFEFHRVEYDVERTASAIENSGMPSAFAEMLREGTG